MDLETIALIAMGGCLFLWLVVNFIITLHNVRIAKAAGLTVQVQCEKCGTIYEVTGKEATRPAMVKYKKSSRTHISNGSFVNTQNYSHYAKKFHCPCCDKKTYGKVLDIQELQYVSETHRSDESFTPDMLVDAIRALNNSLSIPANLTEVGVTEDKIDVMADDAMKSGNIMVNPRRSTKKDIVALYKKAM